MPNIKTYCRIKPAEDTYTECDINKTTIFLRVPEVLKDFSSNYKGSRSFINHKFNFDHVFDQDASQEQVFDIAALDIINAFLNGYNGTIFAYGQTGTGKTYTVEGSAKTYQSRGLEPRALSMVYKELEKRTNEDLSIHISYLEIYQEVGYDLLNPGARTQSFVTPFPKVNVVEGPSGSCVVRNLTNHLAASEDVAQSLLLQGQANRKVAATAIHDRSSRSHAVFTIQLMSKKADADVIVRSKLHLVDLAGSERVAKTKVGGQQLTEAKSINLSLHHLENVIVALQEESLANSKVARAQTSVGSRNYNFVTRPRSADVLRGPRHVPYRNSVLTMLLRDSLGGNCMTAMISTISLEISNLGESISTCRFAGRVACIANSISRNEELDEKSLIRKLKKRIAELETELACLKLTQEEGTEVKHTVMLNEDDKLMCVHVVRQYLSGQITDPITAGITNPYKFRECLRILKRVISRHGHTDSNNNENQNILSVTLPTQSPEENGDADAAETLEKRNVQKLKVDWDRGRVKMTPAVAETKANKAVNVLLRRTNSFDGPRRPLSYISSKTETAKANKDLMPPRKTQAWDNESVENMSTFASGDESLHKSNSRKDPETLSEFLQMTNKPKTPYEQKKFSEIKKLNSKVEKIQTERVVQEQQVTTLKLQVAEKELDLMERHMKTKLGVTKSQVQDQTAYVKQLLTTEADQGLIDQERLVEKQLRKRMDKCESQLKYIEFRREQLKSGVLDDGETLNTSATVQDKFGQFRKRDGSLNTRQVFQMLKSEERKQEKAKSQIEREKILATANLIEIKEFATRQKLRDLKEAMVSGSSFVPKSVLSKDLMNGHVTTEGGSLEMGEKSDKNQTEMADSFISKQSKEDTYIVNFAAGSKVNGNDLPFKEFYNKKKTEKDPTSKWESNYSRPTTPSNLSFSASTKMVSSQSEESKVELDISAQEKGKSNRVRFKPDESQLLSLTAEDLLDIKSKKLERELSQNYKTKRSRESDKNFKTYMPTEYVHEISNHDEFDARKMNLSSKNFETALSSMLGQRNNKLYPESADYEQYARTSKYQPNPYMTQQMSTPKRLKGQSSSNDQTERQSLETKNDDHEAGGSPFTAKMSHYIQQSPGKEQARKHKQRPSSEEGALDMRKFLRSNTFSESFNSTIEIEEDHPGKVTALKEQEREKTFMSKAQVERDRVHRIRKARLSAEIIQRAWRHYLKQKQHR